jgi:hypothetical protein
MTWKFQPAAASFEEVRNDWDALNQRTSNHILLDSGFVAPLLRYFPEGAVLLGSSDDAETPGMALLVPRGTGRWETFQPSQAPIGLMLLGSPNPRTDSLTRLTLALPGYAFQLSVLQQDPDYSPFVLNLNSGMFERLDYIQTARITLAGTFEDYWKARGTNLRHNVAKRRRRLVEKGYRIELTEVRSPSEVEAAIREYGNLESQGWKGRDGTAVAIDNAQGCFYRDVFQYFCARGEAVIFQLRFNDRVASSDLCLVRNGMMIVLKTAYDEQLNEYSPAFLMREEILQRSFAEQQVRRIEFYGRVMEWHTRWSNEIRTLYHVNCFRHRWVAPLKKLVRRFA